MAISAVIIRKLKWQAWQIRAYNKIPRNTGRVFPHDGQPPPARISSMPLGYIAKWVVWVGILIGLIWVAAAGYALIELPR